MAGMPPGCAIKSGAQRGLQVCGCSTALLAPQLAVLPGRGSPRIMATMYMVANVSPAPFVSMALGTCVVNTGKGFSTAHFLDALHPFKGLSLTTTHTLLLLSRVSEALWYNMMGSVLGNTVLKGQATPNQPAAAISVATSWWAYLDSRNLPLQDSAAIAAQCAGLTAAGLHPASRAGVRHEQHGTLLALRDDDPL